MTASHPGRLKRGQVRRDDCHCCHAGQPHLVKSATAAVQGLPISLSHRHDDSCLRHRRRQYKNILLSSAQRGVHVLRGLPNWSAPIDIAPLNRSVQSGIDHRHRGGSPSEHRGPAPRLERLHLLSWTLTASPLPISIQCRAPSPSRRVLPPALWSPPLTPCFQRPSASAAAKTRLPRSQAPTASRWTSYPHGDHPLPSVSAAATTARGGRPQSGDPPKSAEALRHGSKTIGRSSPTHT